MTFDGESVDIKMLGHMTMKYQSLWAKTTMVKAQSIISSISSWLLLLF